MIKVTLIAEDGSWMLNIEGKGDTSFGFFISEPYLRTYQEWMDFLDKKEEYLNFYQGNGSGWMRQSDDVIQMVSGPSGSGGDVTSDINVKFDALAPQLREKINQAQNDGLFKLPQ